MRDPDRIPEVLASVRRAWQANPDLRLGQLISNLSHELGRDEFYVEDDELADAAERLYERTAGDEPMSVPLALVLILAVLASVAVWAFYLGVR